MENKPYWYIKYISKENRDEIEMALIEKGIPFSEFIKSVISQIKIGDNLNDLNDEIHEMI